MNLRRLKSSQIHLLMVESDGSSEVRAAERKGGSATLRQGVKHRGYGLLLSYLLIYGRYIFP